MKPIDLLETELKLLKRSKDKSIESYSKNKISKGLHTLHLKNLNPKIKEFQEAINKLK